MYSLQNISSPTCYPRAGQKMETNEMTEKRNQLKNAVLLFRCTFSALQCRVRHDKIITKRMRIAPKCLCKMVRDAATTWLLLGSSFLFQANACWKEWVCTIKYCSEQEWMVLFDKALLQVFQTNHCWFHKRKHYNYTVCILFGPTYRKSYGISLVLPVERSSTLALQTVLQYKVPTFEFYVLLLSSAENIVVVCLCKLICTSSSKTNTLRRPLSDCPLELL